ncbi:unnamed protein product (macronuclear) [Paramecium tetraurelia]|uniref:EGF-like domain-containing protein n=1 Tax=Paramecium tetraurelia TaxID=5888 RepID=A0CJP3_PARTE|nr:uncharacterized protein GSPATT00000722001 [Paramecium tetraurelia]CAK71010.1 unnamed protein product [Paramecium tetraurelia]|eukprot:XP_001438407.1 hypothetical protein (macronuclear) [Paramecium tetraurelia strain d4-2]
MFHLVFFLTICTYVYAQTKFLLQGPLPLNIDCKIQSPIENGFIGNQYFYNSLSQNGTLLNLDKITFSLWMQVHSDPQLKEKQLIFAFYDGNQTATINVMLYYQTEKDGTYLYFINEKFSQQIIKLKITIINKVWNFLFISIDQSTDNCFINLKFFSIGDTSNNPQFFQAIETLVSQKLPYIFNERSRITNEMFNGFSSRDQKACINIANFYYINGWISMDKEFYVDYDSELKFQLKPFASDGIVVSNTYTDIILRKFTIPIEYTGSIGMNFYKNTQIVYNFFEQLPSVTIMFWVKPQSLVSSFQFLSFTDDVLQETSIGFGVNKLYNLLFYQGFSKTPVCSLSSNVWNHVTVGILDISINDDFKPLNQRKLLRIFIGNVERNLTIITNVKPYQKLVLGPVFMDDQGSEIVEIQDIKIFKGFGIRQTYNQDCQIFVGSYCAFCKPSTHFCKEQDPNDDSKFYICPAGYKYENYLCKKIMIPNCLRMSSSSPSCEICDQNYNLISGLCQLKNLAASSPFTCSDTNAQLCSFNITQDVILQSSNTKQVSKLCSNNKYSNAQSTCALITVPNCDKAQYQSGCSQCSPSYIMTDKKTCATSCLNALRFIGQSNICVGKCDRYLFKAVCQGLKYKSIQYNCSLQKNCTTAEMDIGYYCLPIEFSVPGKTQNCLKLTANCNSICKHCFGTDITHCLACYSDMYYNPYMTTCMPNCNNAAKGNIFLFNNKIKWLCEKECPTNLYTQNSDCVQICSAGYKLYDRKCILTTQNATYGVLQDFPNNAPPTQMVVLKYCPQFCKQCTSEAVCTSCLNQYPMDQNMCVESCHPQYLEVIDNIGSCRMSCDPHDLIYDNEDINGYKIKQCFKIKCGSIRVNKDYQTFLHQSDSHRCMYPCDDGYYGNTLLLQCLPCNPICATCSQSAIYCTSCPYFKFLDQSGCYDSCQGKYQNYLNSKCEGSCSLGFQVMDVAKSIFACVEYCGANYPTYLYSWNNRCYEEAPTIGAYCVDKNCYNCNYKCKTCFGPDQNQCLSCKAKSYLLNNECVKQCYPLYNDNIKWECVDKCTDSIQTYGPQVVNGSTQTVTYCSVTCLFNQYQFKEKCYNSKPAETYCLQRTNYLFCDSCASVCKECQNAYSTSCSRCAPGAYIYGTTCYTDCPDNAPYKDTGRLQCVTNCDYYAENGICVYSCSSSYYQYPEMRTCYQMGCPMGTYNIKPYKICYKCYTGCATCTSGYQNGCLTCQVGYFMNGGTTCINKCIVEPDLVQDWVNSKCVQQCPFGTFIRTLDNGALACTEDCPKYYYSNICVSECPSQTYLDKKICKSCAGPCSECFGVKVFECTKCDIGYYRDETTCYAVCPDPKPYANLADSTCVTTCPDYLYLKKKYCFSPCPGFLYQYELNGKKECVDQCYSNSYLWLGKCYQCDPICKECFGPNNGNCLECQLPYFLDEQTCGNTCPQFYDLTDHVCKDACPVNLVIQGMNCQNECDLGYLVYNQVCVNTCPNFAYQVGDHCYDCNLYCSTCFGPTADECYSCIDNYFLYQQSCKSVCPHFYNKENKTCMENCSNMYEIAEKKECVTTCPSQYILCESKCILVLEDGYYLNGNQCVKCDPKCSKCTSATVCQACAKNFYLEVTSCVNFCSNEYLFMDPISSSCVTKCPSTLYHLESFGKRFCVSDCPYKLYDQCVSACPSGMYPKDTICTQCPKYCNECESATKCSSCLFGYYLQDEQCQLSCTIGKTDRKNIKCVDECDPTLFEYQNECLENCPTDPIVYKNKQICALSCPIATYQDAQECRDCDSSCTSCIGPSYQDCITCSNGYYLDNQICTQTCSNLYDEVNKQCVLTCPTNLYLDLDKCVAICSIYEYNSVCVSTCPPLTYFLNKKCHDCSENCQECNSIGCIKCAVGTYLDDGLCNNYCPYYYNDVNNECAQLCPKDTYLYIDHCYSQCPLSTFQYKKDCLLACPSLTVLQNTQCVQCPERCLTCKNEYECSKCESPYFLFNGSCVIHCPLQLPFEDITNGQCVSVCPPEAYERGYECIKECNLIIYQKQCLQACPTGYYGNDYCKPCRLECKACSTFEVCTECNDNFFLEYNQCDTQCTKIKDLKSKSCVDTCNSLLYKNVCYQTCPQNTYENTNECVLSCNDGYYGSQDFKCIKCPQQCGTCTSVLQCTKCNIGYFLYNKQCLDQCPGSFFSNPILNECSNKCPLTTFIFQNSCLFECPSEYLNDMENYKCVNSCGSQQYLSKKNCLSCAIECDSCTGRGNNNCIKCASGFTLTEDGICLGSCKDGYYKSDNSCQQCLHKCQTCENGTDCKKCRGTNRNLEDCSCQKGYYDDEYQDDCKRCPCDECTAADNCLICKNNLQVPKCSCDRVLNQDWCITCQVAKVNIYYTDDLNEIIVHFGYLISVDLINPFQPFKLFIVV